MNRTITALGVLALGLVAGGAGAESRVTRVAVYDLQVDGPDARTASIFISSVAIELRKLKAVDVVTMDEIRAMLDFEAERAAMGCDAENSCLSEIAEALGVDVLLTGSVADVGDERIVALQRVEQGDAKVSGRFQVRLVPSDGSELLAAVGPAIEKLFADRELRAGQTRGVDEAIALQLNPPPLPPFVFWTAAGTGVSALAVGGALLGAAFVPYAAATDAAGSASSAAEVRAPYETANGLFLSGQVVGLVGVGLVGVAAGLALFTDFAGVGEQ